MLKVKKTNFLTLQSTHFAFYSLFLGSIDGTEQTILAFLGFCWKIVEN
jgi:hypothetical protein